MAYATHVDILKRRGVKEETLDIEYIDYIMTLLEDAAVIIDTYNKNASESAKKIVSCSMVTRVLGSVDDAVPVGTTQGTTSALGYSQTWVLGSSGASGELYLSKTDKRILGCGNKITFVSQLERQEE